MKKNNDSLLKELEASSSLHTLNEDLVKENASLKKKVDDLTNIVHKFTLGKKTFDMMLDEKRCVFNKNGLGFK